MEKQETANEKLQGWQKIIEASFNDKNTKDLSSFIAEMEEDYGIDENETKAPELSGNTIPNSKSDQSKETMQDTKDKRDLYDIESTFDAMSIEDVEEETLSTYRR